MIYPVTLPLDRLVRVLDRMRAEGQETSNPAARPERDRARPADPAKRAVNPAAPAGS